MLEKNTSPLKKTSLKLLIQPHSSLLQS